MFIRSIWILFNVVRTEHFGMKLYNDRGTRWRSGCGTALRTGRSRDQAPMASLEFFIDIILPAALCSWVWLSLYHQEYFLGIKAADARGWQPYHLYVPIVLKSGNFTLLEPSRVVKACNGIAVPLPLLYNDQLNAQVFNLFYLSNFFLPYIFRAFF
jgi:hypothetical protein